MPADDWPFDPQADPALSRHVTPDGSVRTQDGEPGSGFEALRARRTEHETAREKPKPKAAAKKKPAKRAAKPKAAKAKGASRAAK